MVDAPFPYFGGKSRAAEQVWKAFGRVDCYVEPFCGSAAMLLRAPDDPGRIETINDLDGFVVNFYRAVAADPEAVTYWADWPVSEADLHARHSWLINRRDRLRWLLDDPDFCDPKIAGWWVWGQCAWIGSGWCAGNGPWVGDGVSIQANGERANGIWRQLPHLSGGGRGINRKLPHLGDNGRGIHRLTLGRDRTQFIRDWFARLHRRLRDVRIVCGDWQRALGNSVTVRHGVTAVFLDPPYTTGDMDYAAGGVGGELASAVRDWCAQNGTNLDLRIVLCGHDGEHNALQDLGWVTRKWEAKNGYAKSDEGKQRTASERLWCSPACLTAGLQHDLFDTSASATDAATHNLLTSSESRV